MIRRFEILEKETDKGVQKKVYAVNINEGSKEGNQYFELGKVLPNGEIKITNNKILEPNDTDIEENERRKELFRLFVEGKKAALQGTPVEKWEAISPEIAQEMKDCGIFNVEDLVNAPDTAFQNLGPGSRKYQVMAREFVNFKPTQDPQIDKLKAELDEMKALLAEALENKKPKRQNRKKEDVADDAEDTAGNSSGRSE